MKDPELDKLLAEAAATLDEDKRQDAVRRGGQAHQRQVLRAVHVRVRAGQPRPVKGVHGPGLTTKLPAVAVNPPVSWHDVYKTSGTGQ